MQARQHYAIKRWRYLLLLLREHGICDDFRAELMQAYISVRV